MLAEDEISIRIARETIYLKPTLRAALRLERRFGGFDKIVEAIVDENVTVMAAVMRESATTITTVPDLIEGLAGMTLDKGIRALKEPLIAHVLRLAGHDPENPPASSDDEPVPFAEHHARLFELATGWLGWTPETAYSSTAAEITAAYKGRVDLISTVLKAVFGEAATKDDGEQDAEIFNSKLAATMAFATARFAANASAA